MVGNSFNEFAGIPASELETKYYFTWNTAGSDRTAWTLVGNPSTTEAANVTITVGNGVTQDYVIAPRENITPSFGVVDGPISVESTNGVPIYTTQRVVIGDSFNEFAGIPASTLDTKYYFTWNTAGSDRAAWTLVGNPSTTETANVTIKVGDQVTEDYTIPPGENITPSFDVVGGPVSVESTNGVPIYTTQRVVIGGSFNEFAGIPASSLATKYYFTWNTAGSDRTAWTLVGNPSTSETANVTIKVGDIVTESYSIPPGENITPSFDVTGGPISVECTNGVPIYTTQRVVIGGSFNELPGITVELITAP
jgi:hypothetical protein